MTRTVLLDIDGVLTVSWRPLPGAVETLRWLRGQDITFGLITNTSSKPGSRDCSSPEQSWFRGESPADGPLLSGAARFLAARYPDADCLVINEGAVDEDLAEVRTVHSNSPGVVLLGGAGASVGYRELNSVFNLAAHGVAVVALHRNTRFQTVDGPALDMGAFIVGLEIAAGVEIPVVGKPSPEFFMAALRELGASSACRSIIVGDDIDSDVHGGQLLGMTGVLVRTGQFRRATFESKGRSPDYVIDGIGKLSDVL